jgi:hypothetical protein
MALNHGQHETSEFQDGALSTRRPLGVTLLAAWSWFWGCLLSILLLGIPLCLIGYGLWRMRGWAWWASVLFAALSILLTLALRLTVYTPAAVVVIATVALPFAMSAYLWSPPIRRAFCLSDDERLPPGLGQSLLLFLALVLSGFVALLAFLAIVAIGVPYE